MESSLFSGARMFFSGGQCGHVGRPEELLLTFKIFLVIVCLHVVLVTSLEEHADDSSLLSPSAESPLVGFVPYSNEVETTSLNDATSSVLSTLNKTEKTKITIVKTFNASGVKPQRNICNLSSVCNDSAFFRGEIMFQYAEESNVTQSEIMANVTLTGILSLSELKRSELNKTLQTLSETYFIVCATAEAQSTLNCTFTVKLNKTMNICAVMVALQTVNIRPMEQCCCPVWMPCPSSPEQLEKLQCDLQDPVVCLAGHPHGPPFSSSSSSIPAAPQATIVPQISSAFSFAEPLAHPPVTHSPHSPTGVIRLLSPQPSAPIASSPAIDMPPQSGTLSPPTLPTDLSRTLPPAKSSLPFPTTSPPVNVITTSTPPDKTEIVHTSSISVSDLENQVFRMEKALSLGSLEPNLAGQMINQVSKLLHSPPTLLAPLAQRLLKVVDDIGLQLNFSTKSISLTSPSLALAVIRVNASNFNTTTFAAQDPANLQVSLETQAPGNSIGVITLPSSLMSNLPANDVELASRVQFNFFETPALFQDPALENLSLISYVISSSVANLTVKNLTRNVTVTLKHISPSQDDLTVRCVFWDLGINGGRGGWSSDGCSVKDRRLNETTCTCSHLTSFGVLLDLSRTSLPPAQIMALTFITYIGCGLSSIFLSVTLVTYIAFEGSLWSFWGEDLLDSWIALYDIRGLCISVAVFLHYFLLVSFTWMGLEAFHMYLALVKVFNTYIRKYILKFCIVGWGVPAVVVTIVLIISPDNYGLGSYGKFPNGSPDDFCWINSNAIFYITVVGYFSVIFLLNVSMFIVVLVQLCRIKKKKQLGAQRKTSIQDLRSVAGLTFLLGITWGFAFFAWGPVNVTFMYLFAIFNTLQGFFIFIFYCVAKENVRKQWRRYLCCGKLRLAENSDWSKTATNGLKKQTVNQGVSSSSNSLQSNSNSTHSTTLLVNNECSGLMSGNGNASTEKNGVSFNVQNGDVCLHDFTGKQHMFNEKEDSCNGKSRIALRRTSKRGSLHFIEQM
uniref:Adhesion G-protein coupled receptor G2 n=1 Tax=Camelus bactrianus TaxID=9837 RepID=A0A9W3EP91_CAMBA|nr:adhesion G-protein coupled receptor G2 [Camelus bactrianus]